MNKNEETVLYMLEETSPFMMSFVIITKNDNAIIVDGGRPEDMPLLKKYVGGRRVKAWFLTHAHSDHVSGFFDEVKKNGLSDFDVERVIYKFPPFNEWLKLENVPDLEYFRSDISEMSKKFYEIEDTIKDITHIPISVAVPYYNLVTKSYHITCDCVYIYIYDINEVALYAG